jgi:nucleotide-binding universal stress UspA family protein
MFKHLLIAVDGTPASEQAAEVGLAWAKKTNSRLVFAHVIEERGLQAQVETKQRFGQAFLEAWVRMAQQQTVEAKLALVRGANIAQALADVAELEHCDLIVMGTHGREGLPHLLQGSVAERVAQLTSIPVMFVRRSAKTHAPNFDHLLVAIDLDEITDLVLDQAAEVARQLGSTLEVLHVLPDAGVPLYALETGAAWDPNDEAEQMRLEGEDLIAAAWTRIRSRPFDPKMLDIRQVPAKGIGIQHVILREAAAKNVGLIVIGTNARRGLEKFLLGSIAESLLHHADVPVLVVRPHEVQGSVPAHALETKMTTGPRTLVKDHKRAEQRSR